MEFKRLSTTIGHHPKDSLDRFGDDLCGFLLKFLDPNDKFRLECVSKQWKGNVHRQCTELILGSGGIDLYSYRRPFHDYMSRRCRKAYAFVRKIVILSDFAIYEEWFYYLPRLEEIVIYDIPSFDLDDINDMSIKRTIKKFSIKQIIDVEYVKSFNKFQRKYIDRVKNLKIRFLNGPYVYINRLSAFKNLGYLRIYNDIDTCV